ncbi:KRAB-A domain-containing protein 2-like [Palaemon carinicauda]|uniref:KRAB-A domain-containing protein 2-like n=1 Tax=Palaemon carinicauda TaxID=392227 RepID=UPI0035B6A7E6
METIHRTIDHGGRTSMCKATKEKYANISRDQITLFLQYCEECQVKKISVRKCVVVKPIISNSMNSRAQFDLIDMQSQPDGKYRFIFNYQDHLAKMICLRALQTKTAEDVAFHLADIFCDKRAPHILQSDNGREFSNKNISESWRFQKLRGAHLTINLEKSEFGKATDWYLGFGVRKQQIALVAANDKGIMKALPPQ